MSRELIGKANYLHKDDSMSTLDVHIVEPEDGGVFVTVGDEDHQESIIINSLEQWRQLNSLVLRAIDCTL